jgi:Formate/nitrite family of transporters
MESPSETAATRREEHTAGEKARREDAEREIDDSAATLTRKERRKVNEATRLSALTVFEIIRREGEEELRRPAMSLWWSGVAAGIGISSSVFAQALLYDAFADSPHRQLISCLGYTVGFVLVILSRLQLFTENTLSVVLPTLSEPTWGKLGRSGRLWSIVLTANFIGTFLTALLILVIDRSSAAMPGGGHVEAMLAVSRHAAETSGWAALVMGVPAGFFIAALVWMLPSSRGFAIWIIILFTGLIAAGGFTHIVAGSTEMFLLVVAGEMGVGEALLGHLAPIFAGNVIGGTGLFAMLAYGQIHAEI